MELQQNFSLKHYNTFGIDVSAKYFALFTSVDELAELLNHASTLNHLNPKLLNPKPSNLILGGGSNLLFTKNYDGLVLKNELKGIQKIHEDETHIYIKAGAGENWHRFVLYCIQHNYAGAENLSLIPGNVGASPMQNIGAYGVEIKDIFHELTALHRAEKKIVTFNLNDCRFGYRESVFKNKFKDQFVITDVTYKLNKQPKLNTAYGAIEQELQRMNIKDPGIKDVSDAVINIRRSKLPDPAVTGNAGSFFKNPSVTNEQYTILKENFPEMIGYALPNGFTKLAAGWLIEQCGWKGVRKGDAGCHPKQALVLVNYGHAKGTDIFDLSEEILQSVKQKFNVVLEREVNII
ncbi:MAG: UDP-N-acetylmuramate dehydrogenase [Ferruginibacter sp.]